MMGVKKDTYSPRQIAAALLMLLTLLWLSVSTPFVYGAQQSGTTEKASGASQGNYQSPLPDEEKSQAGFSSINEYLHEDKHEAQIVAVPLLFEKCHASVTYVAYHPDQHCPPPNFFV